MRAPSAVGYATTFKTWVSVLATHLYNNVAEHNIISVLFSLCISYEFQMHMHINKIYCPSDRSRSTMLMSISCVYI